MEQIDYLRQRIDDLDRYIVRLLELRFETVSQVADYKLRNNMAVFDASREEAILNWITEMASVPEYAAFIREAYIGLMNASKNMQLEIIEKKTGDALVSIEVVVSDKIIPASDVRKENFKIVYQGVPGSYSEEALGLYVNDAQETIGVTEFVDVFQKVEAGEADYGILPIENSSTGSVAETIDLLAKGGFYICGEVVLPVKHNLLGVPGADLSDIKEVYSHQQGFLQCGEFLSKHPEWLKIPYINTAISAKMVAESKDKSKAAISSKRAAEIYGLNILESGINGQDENSTRFVIFSKSFEVADNADKISIMFTLPHKSGTLYHTIKKLADRGLNMLKIESRPVKERNWEYVFFIDFEGSLKEQRCLKALVDIKKEAGYFRLLGNYKGYRGELQKG